MTESFIQSTWAKKDPAFDSSLRPKSLKNFLGQKGLKEKLHITIEAAKERGEPLGHCLFHGPPGLGKTTLANILAKEMGTNLVVTSGPVIDKPADLAGILTNLKKGDILFIDEIHRLNRAIEEYLYPAMENYVLDLLIDSGPSSRTVQIQLERFTLVGATTRSGLLSSPMRSRFPLSCRLDFYDDETLSQILLNGAALLNVDLGYEAALEMAARARGTPRIAHHLLRWTRDVCQIQKEKTITPSLVQKSLEMLAIDHLGLDEMDKKLLSVIIDHHSGGPVGLNTLAVALSEDPSTLSEVYEPYLVLKGLLRHTSRGREATKLAYDHLGKAWNRNETM